MKYDKGLTTLGDIQSTQKIASVEISSLECNGQIENQVNNKSRWENKSEESVFSLNQLDQLEPIHHANAF